MTTSPQRGKLEKKTKRIQDRSAARGSLVLAELSYQRGDIAKALQLLERLRLKSKSPGFSEENLYGCSLGLSLESKKAVRVFEKLSRKHRKGGLFYEKARFNLGLVHFYQDMLSIGDLSITRQAMGGNSFYSPEQVSTRTYDAAFSSAISIWEDLLPRSKHYKNIILTFLAFACLQRGDLEKALDYIVESHTLSKNFYIADYVTGRIFLDFYFLTEDSISFSLTPEIMAFFDIGKEDILRDEGTRFQLFGDAYIRVAHDAFFEAQMKNDHSPEVMIGLIICYFYFGQIEELQRYLIIVESMIPNSKALLDTVYWLVRESSGTPDEIKGLLERLKALNETASQNQVFQTIAPHFLI